MSSFTDFKDIFKNGEWVVVTNHDYDSNKRRRRNSRRARLLEEEINQKGFFYNKFTQKIKAKDRLNPNSTHNETVTFFVVKTEDSKDEIFKDCTINSEVENFTIGRSFAVPHSESEKREFIEKHIVFPENIFVFPDELGDWKYYENNVYINKTRTSILAIVSDNHVSVGSCIPVGVTIKKQETKSLQESLDFLKTYAIRFCK